MRHGLSCLENRKKHGMPKILVLTSAFLCLAVLASAQEIVERRISDSILFLEGGGGNVTAVATDDGVVVFDTFMTPASAGRARELIEKFSDKPIRYVVNTHYHGDHTFGNQVFADAVIIGRKGIFERIQSRYGTDIEESIAGQIADLEKRLHAAEAGSEEAKELETLLAEARKEQADFAVFVLTLPTISLEGNATIFIGGITIKIFYMGPGHSDTDLVILVPEEKLLIMGDLYLPKRIPYLDWQGGADVENWIAMFDKLIEMGDHYDHVVSGHGGITGVDGLKEQQECMTDLWTAVQDAWNRGLTLEQAKEEIKLEKYADYTSFERGRLLNIENCWRILERKTK
jgi:cyclase